MKCNHSQRCVGKIANKTIMIDANLIISLGNAIAETINMGESMHQKITTFNNILRMYLSTFCKCPASDLLLTSDQILNNELDPRNLESAIVENSPFLRGYFRYQRRVYAPHMQTIWDTLTSAIRGIPIDAAEILALSTLLGGDHHLSEEDLSLMVCATKGATQQRESVVVTADLNLENKIIEVAKLGTIRLPSGQYLTNRIVPIDVYSYICHIHECCEMATLDNKPIFLHLIKSDLERMAEMTERVAKRKRARMYALISERERIVEKKSQPP